MDEHGNGWTELCKVGRMSYNGEVRKMHKRLYTQNEITLFGNMAAEYKQNGGLKTAYVERLAEAIPNRTFGALNTAFISLTKRGSLSRRRLTRKKIIAEKSDARKLAGQNRWASIQAKLRAYGLTDVQIKEAWSGKVVWLDKTVIAEIENTLTVNDKVTVTFLKMQDGSVNIVSKQTVNQPVPQIV